MLHTLFSIIRIATIVFVGFFAVILIGTSLPLSHGYQVRIVTSGSMEPAIKTRSIIFIRPTETLKKGDIITFKNNASTIPTTHRIVDVRIQSGTEYFLTKGDANNGPDSAEIPKEDVLGKVFLSVPYVGYITDFVKKPLGFLLLIIIPLLTVAYDEIKKIIDEIKKIRTKKDTP